MAGIVINIGNKNGVLNLPYTNAGTPLAQSPKLRQAFAEAIDRDTLMKVAWGAGAEPTCDIVPPNDTEWYAQTKVPCTPYDPTDAKKLVAASGYPTPITVHQYFATSGDNNVSGYSNPRLDYVLANGLKATDPKARAVDYRVAQQIILNDRPIIPLRHPVDYAEFASDLTGIQYDPFGDLDLANAQYKS